MVTIIQQELLYPNPDELQKIIMKGISPGIMEDSGLDNIAAWRQQTDWVSFCSIKLYKPLVVDQWVKGMHIATGPKTDKLGSAIDLKWKFLKCQIDPCFKT